MIYLAHDFRHCISLMMPRSFCFIVYLLQHFHGSVQRKMFKKLKGVGKKKKGKSKGKGQSKGKSGKGKK